MRLPIVRLDRTAMSSHGAGCDRKPQTETIRRPARLIHAKKWFEQAREGDFRNPGTFIFHANSYDAIASKHGDLHFCVWRRVMNGVANDILHRTVQQLQVAADLALLRRLYFDGTLQSLSFVAGVRDNIVHDSLQRDT